MHERPSGKVGMYTRFFDYANYRIPFSNFFVSVLVHFRILFSQLYVFGSAKVSHFEIMCRVCNIEPSFGLFCYFYTHNYKNGWFGFTKRPNVRACYSKNFDSVKNWNDYFFWVDEFVVPVNARFNWFLGSNIVKDRAPVASEYNMEHVTTLTAQASPFLRFLEEFLCWVGISRNYLLKKDTYPRFEYEDGEEMDLNAFIQTADPRKHRTVTLLPTSVARTFGELSESIDREFGNDMVGDGNLEGASAGGHGNVVTAVATTNNVATKTGAPGPKRSKKKKLIRGPESAPTTSHPPKRLRADYVKPSGPTVVGKSPHALNTLLQDSLLSVEQGVRALHTLPFVTSSVTASPLEEGGDHTDSVTGPSLRSVAASVRFVVLSDSSHHSGGNSAGPEADSFVRSTVSVTTKATVVTTVATTLAIPSDADKDKSVSVPSVFGASISSDHTLSLFTGRSGSGFAAGSIRAEGVADAGLEEIYVPEWTVTKGFELNDRHFYANMIDHFTPPTFFKTIRGMEHEQLSLAEEKDNLLGVKDKEIEELRSQLLKAKEESAVVTQLRAQVSNLEAIEGSLRGEVASAKGCNDLLEQERDALRLQVENLESTVVAKDRELSSLEISSSSLRSQNQGLVSQVHELEASSSRLREQLDVYEENLKHLEEF
ncbi:hypothetical protein Tco_0789134 [Tanacetum coccineum]